MKRSIPSHISKGNIWRPSFPSFTYYSELVFITALTRANVLNFAMGNAVIREMDEAICTVYEGMCASSLKVSGICQRACYDSPIVLLVSCDCGLSTPFC